VERTPDQLPTRLLLRLGIARVGRRARTRADGRAHDEDAARGSVRSARLSHQRLLAVAAALGLALGLVGAPANAGPVAAIDPCFGYDLCVHLSVVAMGRPGENGNGVVTSSPAGISCRFLAGAPQTGTSTCDAYFHNNFVSSISVTLNATADSGSSVICDTHGSVGEPSCSDGPLLFSSSTSAAFAFHFAHDPVTVSIGNAGQPGGFVYSTPIGIDCGETYAGCSHAWPWGTSILLYAEGDNGGGFVAWTGACAGNNESCELLLQNNILTTATFAFPSTPPPTATPRPSSPGPTHTPFPIATPHASGPAPTQVGPLPTTAQSTSAPGATVLTPASSGLPGPSAGLPGGSSEPAQTIGPTPADVAVAASAGASAPPPQVAPTEATSSSFDPLPIVFAIVVGCGLIALGILGAAALMRRGPGAQR